MAISEKEPWAKRNFGRPYAKLALRDAWRNVRLLVIIIGAGAASLWLMNVFNAYEKAKADSKREPYAATTLLTALSKNYGPHVAEARMAMLKIGERESDKAFKSRDDVVAAVIAEVAVRPGFPTARRVIENHQDQLEDVQASITALPSNEKDRSALDALLRKRDFILDDMRLQLAAVSDQQTRILADVADRVDEAIADGRTPAAKSSGSSVIGEAAAAESPLHVLFESIWYVALAIVVMAIGYCAAAVLKLLPFPGAADKWSHSIEETFVERRRSGDDKSSPVASFIFSAAVLGIGAIAAGQAMREQAGSPLHGMHLGDMLPSSRGESVSNQEAGGSGGGGASGNVSVGVNVRTQIGVQPTPLQNFFNPTFAPNNPITTPKADIKIEPAKIEGLTELKTGVDQIALASQKAADGIGAVQNALAIEKEKTEQLKTLVDDAKKEWSVLGGKVETAGSQIRGSITTADYNGEQRWLAETHQQATAGTRRWWRQIFALSRYRVNDTTMAVFAREPEDGHSAELHQKLHDALKTMNENPFFEPDYAAPFETTIIANMIGKGALKDPKERDPARDEVRHHLAVILEASRVP